MKKIKKILIITGIVLASIILILVAVPFLFKGKILKLAQEQANANLNAKLEFADLKLSLIRHFPSLSVELVDLNIVGIGDFEKDTLVKFDSFLADLNLKSVISGDQIKINAVILKKPTIYAKILQDGRANWDIAKPDTSAGAETKKDTTESKFAVALKKFEIKNAQITFDDQKSNIYSKIQNLNFSLKGDLTQDQTAMKILLTIDSLSAKMQNISYLKKARLEFKSNFDANLKNLVFTFKDNVFKINEIELGFEGFVAMPDTNIDVDIKFDAKKTEFKSVLSMIPAVYMKDFDGVQTSGNFSFEGFAKGRYNATEIPSFMVHLLVNNARFQYPSLPKSAENINVDVKVENPGNIDINIVNVNKFHVELGSNPVDAVLQVKTSSADVELKGDIKAKIDLLTLKDVIPLDDMSLTGNINADVKFDGLLSTIEKEQYDQFQFDGLLEMFNIKTIMEGLPPILVEKAQLQFSPQFVSLNYFDTKIGKSDVHLRGKIDNLLQYVFKEQLLVAKFDFSSELFDANEFLTGESTPENQTTQPTETSAFEIPKNINFALTSNLKKVLYEKLEITNIAGLIILKDGKADLSNLAMNLLQGTMILSGSYDSRNIEQPAVEFALNINNFDLPSTYKAFLTIQKLAPIVEKCSGKVSANLSINTKFDSKMNPVYNTLNGRGNFKSNDISLNNVKLINNLADLTKQNKFKNPALKDISVNFKIENGNITIEPTEFKMAETVVTLEGTTNLDESINYLMGMTLPSDIANNLLQNLQITNQSNEIQIAAIIGGTITDPKIVKFSTSLTDVIKDKVEEIKEDLKAEAQKILDEANARAQKIIDDAKVVRDQLVAEAQKKAQKIKDEAQKASDKLINEASKQGDDLIKKANNPIAKEAAKQSKQELIKKAKVEANKKIQEGNKQVDSIVKVAKDQGDKIVKEAENQAAKIKSEANEKVRKL